MVLFRAIRDLVNWYRHNEDAKEFTTYIAFVVIFSVSECPQCRPPFGVVAVLNRPCPSFSLPMSVPKTRPLHPLFGYAFLVWGPPVVARTHACFFFPLLCNNSPHPEKTMCGADNFHAQFPSSSSSAVAFAGTPGDIQYHLNGYARST